MLREIFDFFLIIIKFYRRNFLSYVDYKLWEFLVIRVILIKILLIILKILKDKKMKILFLWYELFIEFKVFFSDVFSLVLIKIKCGLRVEEINKYFLKN